MMRSLFENGPLRRVFWIPQHYMIADALNKYNRQTAAPLNKVLHERTFPRHPDEIRRTTPKGDVLDNAAHDPNEFVEFLLNQ